MLSLAKQTTADMLDTVARATPHAVAAIYQDQELAYGELRKCATSLACGLYAAGLHCGDRVALWMPNCLEWIISEFAVAKLGVSWCR